MNEINIEELKEKQEFLMTEFENFWKSKIEELGFEGFVEFWLNNLNDSIKSLEDPNAETENYLKNIDSEGYAEDPKKLIDGMKKELERQREGYTKIFKEYAENMGKMSAELLMGNKNVKKKDSDIIKLNSILPDNHIIPNTKISNFLNKIVGNGDVQVSVLGNKKKILTIINIDYENKDITLPKSFTAYDRTVLNACISLFEANNECFTVDMVYRCMNGLIDSEKPSPQQKGAITKSLDKMRFLHCNIDFTAEAKARGKDTTKAIMESYILNADKVTLEAGGNEVIGYKFNAKPILYQYAQQVSKQIITIPAKLLNTKDAVRGTDEVIIIREYLIRAISDMRIRNRSNKVTYDGIFEEIGLEITKTQSFIDKSKKLKSSIKKILEYWKSEKYIKSYKEYKEGRAFKGIEIIY